MYACPFTPAADAMLTITPRVSSRCGIAACDIQNTPERFTASMRFHSASEISVACAKLMMPATLQSTSSWPKRATQAATASRHAAGSATSSRCATASPPAAAIAATVSARPASATSHAKTCAPSDGEAKRGRATDAGGGAGDEGGSGIESSHAFGLRRPAERESAAG